MVVTNKPNSNLIIQQQQVNTTNVVNSQGMVSTSSSSLIKSLLANKVTPHENAASITSCLIAPNVNVHQQVTPLILCFLLIKFTIRSCSIVEKRFLC